MILTRSGRPEEAEAFAMKATQLYQSFLTRGANGITLARMHLAESLTAQRKYEEAEQVLGEALRDASETQGRNHLRTQQVEKQLTALRLIASRKATTTLH